MDLIGAFGAGRLVFLLRVKIVLMVGVSQIQEVKDHLPGFDVLIFKHFFSADQRLCCPQAVVM